MKKFVLAAVSALIIAAFLCSCRTVEDTRPANETANPNNNLVTVEKI